MSLQLFDALSTQGIIVDCLWNLCYSLDDAINRALEYEVQVLIRDYI